MRCLSLFLPQGQELYGMDVRQVSRTYSLSPNPGLFLFCFLETKSHYGSLTGLELDNADQAGLSLPDLCLPLPL